MKNLTVLKVVSIIHILLTTLWSLWFFNELNDGKGWGMLFSVGLLAIGIIGLVVSWMLGVICKTVSQEQPKRIQNLIEVALVAGFIVFVAITY
ncbi:hypothetical protein [Ekhidna sp.]|uniref:hypothetical protein n=1 Tax=Ekhidna sp. TaxID=2608089 RepID=UPI003C79C06F